jgi:hypothetical protein
MRTVGRGEKKYKCRRFFSSSGFSASKNEEIYFDMNFNKKGIGSEFQFSASIISWFYFS